MSSSESSQAHQARAKKKHKKEDELKEVKRDSREPSTSSRSRSSSVSATESPPTTAHEPSETNKKKESEREALQKAEPKAKRDKSEKERTNNEKKSSAHEENKEKGSSKKKKDAKKEVSLAKENSSSSSSTSTSGKGETPPQAPLTPLRHSGSAPPPIVSSPSIPLRQSIGASVSSAPMDQATLQLGVEFQESAIRVEDAREKKKKNLTVVPVDKKHKTTLKDLKKEIEMDEHMIPVEEVLLRYETNVTKGLTNAKAAEVLERDGPNTLSSRGGVPWWKDVLRNLFGGFQILLWIAAVLCFISYPIDPVLAGDNLYIGIVLVAVCVITGSFSYYQEQASRSAMKGFTKMVVQQAVVIREGTAQSIDAVGLVVGDVVRVKAGDKIPADILIVDCHEMKVDNSSLTGESEPQGRASHNTHENPMESKNIAFYSTLCVEGTCTGLVVNTGDRTLIGRIAGLATMTESSESTIAIEMEHFVRIISIVAVFFGLLFFFIGLGKFGVSGVAIIVNVVFSIGIIVANVPEAIIATVAVSLTLTAKRMAKKNVLVKNLESVETLGSTSMICSDKTGTLTQNRMTVAHLWYDNTIHVADLTSHGLDREEKGLKDLLRVGTLCNRTVFDANDSETDVKLRRAIGDASETALIRFSQQIRDIDEQRSANPKVAEIPFNSVNKWALSVHKNDSENGHFILMKGAPERVISRCKYIRIQGKDHRLSSKWKKRFQLTYDELGSMGERVLGCAMCTLDKKKFPVGFEFDVAQMNFPVEDMTFLGMFALIDPPREAVPDAVKTCQSAHIQVVMVTGDHPITARAIARQVGIIRDETYEELVAKNPGIEIDPDSANAIVVSGDELKNMTDEELDKVLKKKQIVFARTSPQQKLIIVEGCQRKGAVVAVTGDGVNDSPALKKADIGIAMGISGSDVSKEAADMILQDDNFASIVLGVEEGRLIFDNLKKSIAYTLTSNIPELIPFILFAVIDIPVALPLTLILVIDLNIDIWPAIALAYERPESDIMQRRPRNAKTDKLVNARLIGWAYPLVGVIQAGACLYAFFLVLSEGNNANGFPMTSIVGRATEFTLKKNPNDYHICRVGILPGHRELFGCALYANDGEVSAALLRLNATAVPNNRTLDSLVPEFYRNYVTNNLGYFNGTFGITQKYYVDYCGDEKHIRPTCTLSATWTRKKLVRTAQTAAYIAVLLTSITTLLAAKTRLNSLFKQGMWNWIVNSAIVIETLISVLVVYVPPFNVAFQTEPISGMFWLPGLPWAIALLAFDEVRKWIMRKRGPESWVYKHTYY